MRSSQPTLFRLSHPTGSALPPHTKAMGLHHAGQRPAVDQCQRGIGFGEAHLPQACAGMPLSHSCCCYFEWEKQGTKKIKHDLRDPISQIIYMAGIYRYEQEKQLPVFVSLSRNAMPGIRVIHDRMPVILPKEAREVWVLCSADINSIITFAIDDIISAAVYPLLR